MLLFGLLAIAAAIGNVILSLTGRDAVGFMFLSLSFTALALCFAYRDMLGLARDLVLRSGNFFFLTGASILINSIALFRRTKGSTAGSGREMPLFRLRRSAEERRYER